MQEYYIENSNNGYSYNMPPEGALVERNEMTGTALAHTNDQAGVLAQQAIAAVQARYALAVNRPRNLDYVRQRILHECHRPSFAQVAIYTLPYGQGVTGPTIRFAEMVIRNMGNLFVETQLISDTQQKRIIRVTVTDLETNATYYKDVTVEKTVERNNLRKGQVPLSTRHNSYGKLVYIVECSEGELISKEASLTSKAIRTCALRLVPGDILEEALNVVYDVLNDENARDPDAARKKMIDAFAAKGVTAEMLAKYLGMNDLSAMAPQQITHLQGVFYTLRDGEATWQEIYEASPYRGASDDDDPDGKGGRSAKAADLQAKIADKLAAKKRKVGAPHAAPVEPAPAEPSPDLSQRERGTAGLTPPSNQMTPDGNALDAAPDLDVPPHAPTGKEKAKPDDKNPLAEAFVIAQDLWGEEKADSGIDAIIQEMDLPPLMEMAKPQGRKLTERLKAIQAGLLPVPELPVQNADPEPEPPRRSGGMKPVPANSEPYGVAEPVPPLGDDALPLDDDPFGDE